MDGGEGHYAIPTQIRGDVISTIYIIIPAISMLISIVIGGSVHLLEFKFKTSLVCVVGAGEMVSKSVPKFQALVCGQIRSQVSLSSLQVSHRI